MLFSRFSFIRVLSEKSEVMEILVKTLIWKYREIQKNESNTFIGEHEVYIMEMLTTLFRAKLTTGLADFWVAANAIKACTKIVI